ncbi:hypothetical protein AC630_18090 [Bradyrhizobium sp. AS23.2]|nr:hypothetical protein AC630_18090 [Bradyrhizobium sp. AS23.2]
MDAAFKEHLATLQADLMKVIACGHRADFARECDRTSKLLAELLKANIETMAAREKAAHLEGRLSTAGPPRWRRLTETLTHIPLGAVRRNWSSPSHAIDFVARGEEKQDVAGAVRKTHLVTPGRGRYREPGRRPALLACLGLIGAD